jgi:hypothetical protein
MKRAKRAYFSVFSAALLLSALGSVRKDRTPAVSAMHTLAVSREASAAGSVGRALFPTSDPRDDRERLAIRRRLRSKAPGTYIGEMLALRDSSLARWPDRRDKPLSVWIQPTTDIVDWTIVYADRVRDAFEEWDGLDLPVRFVFVDDSARAEIHVTWIDHFSEPISGRTKWARDDDWYITDANITLAVHHHQGEILDEDAMRAMALHEIGHLLGLDHTQDNSSIMAPKVRVRDLSAADRATVRLLYQLPPGAVR